MSAEDRGWGKGWPDCQQDKITTIICGGSRLNLPVRPEIAPLVAGLVRDLEAARGRAFLAEWSWGFACRPIMNQDGTPTNTPSNHSWGLAIDLDAPQNPRLLKATHRQSHPLRKTFPGGLQLRSTMPDDVEAIAKRWGFFWGGLYASKPDPMHFEFLGTPQAAARLVDDMQRALATKEQDMAIIVRGDQSPNVWVTDGISKREVENAARIAELVFTGLAKASTNNEPFPVPQAMVDNIPTVAG